jgi:hypothetical protein
VQSSTSGSSEVTTPEFTPANLLADAKKFTGKDKVMLAWIAAVEKSLQARTRGAVGGPRNAREVVYGDGTMTYQLGFRANELAEIVVAGSGASDLDLYVFDANGNIIVGDEGYSDDCFVSWVPKWTGTFQIVVVNRGRAANRYELYTN